MQSQPGKIKTSSISLSNGKLKVYLMEQSDELQQRLRKVYELAVRRGSRLKKGTLNRVSEKENEK